MSAEKNICFGVFTFITMTLLLFSSLSAANPLFDEPSYVFDLDTPYLCETADFNCDGNKDFLVTSYTPHLLSIFLGTGDGTFTCSQNSFTFDIGSISLCQLNSDFYPDLVVSNGEDEETIHVYLGDGQGGFQLEEVLMHDHFSVNTGDLNGDGYSDLLLPYNITSHYWIEVYLCDGNGCFLPDSSYEVENYGIAHLVSVPGDLNGDGFVDVAFIPSAGRRLGIMLGNGDGTLQQVYYNASSYENCADWATIEEGDYNEDGFLDLAASAGFGWSDHLVLLNNGTGNYSISDTLDDEMIWLVSADFNLDGDLDLGGSGGTLRICPGWGDGTFGGPIYSNYPNSGQLGVADFDNDGDQDIVRLNDSVYVYLNKTIQQGIEGVENPEGNEPVLSLLKNPISSSAVIEIFIPKECDCRISTYDVNGRLVGILYDGLFSAGNHEIQWNNEGLSPGCYFLMLQTPTGSSSTRCVVVD